MTSDGVRLGALCVIDRKPKDPTAEHAQILVNFAGIVSQEIEREQLLEMLNILKGFALCRRPL